MRNFLLIFSLLLSFFVLSPSIVSSEPTETPPATPITTPVTPPASAEEALGKAEFVFAATVETVTKDAQGVDSIADAFWNKCWKGRKDLTAKLVHIDSQGSMTFEAGETYLFYLSEKMEDGSFKADAASRILKFADAEADLIFLNQKK